MDTDKKIKGLVWAVFFLAVMNLTMLATIFYHVYQSNREEVSVEKQIGIEADAAKFTGRYFRDQLQLNASQMIQFRQVNRTFRQQAQMILSELVTKRRQILEEMSASHTDTIKLNQFSKEIGDLHYALKQATVRYYLAIKQECDSSQQQKLHELFQEIFINDLPLNYPGNHGQSGGGQWSNRFSR